ncbi:WbqC family protein [bacterium]|jgi:hypothetical protein|nr:WbqC family protein [bacterium]
MKLSIHQPAYLPWLGLFHRILKSDTYVFMDTVQFEKNSYTNRNKILTANGETWLTIPVTQKGHMTQTLQDTLINNQAPWKKKHLKSIYFSYKKASHFDDAYPKLEALYAKDHDKLSDFCFDHLLFWLDQFNIETSIIRLSGNPVEGSKNDLLINICSQYNAQYYIPGGLGQDYLDNDLFSDNNIQVELQNFTHPVYTQIHGNFVPNMGIVDYWMNCGNDLKSLLMDQL